MSRHIAVIGAGWAGCAAAIELTAQGHQVTLFDAARTPGGRARKVEFNGLTIDNGQHILLGAYSETLRLMQLIGIDLESALLRVPLQMRYPNNTGIDFVAAKLPAPLHLLAGLLVATGLGVRDKLALAGFAAAAHRIGWSLAHDCSVTDLLHKFKQTERLVILMWRPLCLAALNTPPDQASAQLFLNVLKDSLGATRASSEMLLPRLDLSTLFPQRAIDHVIARGGNVNLGKRIRALQPHGVRWILQTTEHAGNAQQFDQVVVATDLHNATTLLESLTGNAVMPNVLYQPITTCYLQYSATCHLDAVFYAMVDDPVSGYWGQFVFDRGQLNSAQPGLFAVVISAAQQAVLMNHVDLAAAISAQLANVFARPELARPLWTKIISEKRATISCLPAQHRPGCQTGVSSVVLAGDYTDSPYPATLETAVRSGIAAARLLGDC